MLTAPDGIQHDTYDLRYLESSDELRPFIAAFQHVTRCLNAVVVKAIDHGFHDSALIARSKSDERRTGTADRSPKGTGFHSLLQDQITAGNEAQPIRYV